MQTTLRNVRAGRSVQLSMEVLDIHSSHGLELLILPQYSNFAEMSKAPDERGLGDGLNICTALASRRRRRYIAYGDKYSLISVWI